MNKYFLLIIVVFSFGFTGCKKEDTSPQDSQAVTLQQQFIATQTELKKLQQENAVLKKELISVTEQLVKVKVERDVAGQEIRALSRKLKNQP